MDWFHTERVAYLELPLQDSADKHAALAGQHTAGQEHHAGIAERVAYLELVLLNSTDKLNAHLGGNDQRNAG